MIECPDSYYEYVKGRILALNPQRLVLGVMNAQDWPLQDVQFEAFYCLMLGDAYLGKSMYSPTNPVYIHTVQWVWMIQGTDIQVGLRGRSRGDKYRKEWAMKEEIVNAHWPGFATKSTWTAAQQGSTVQLTQTPFDPPESFWWTPPIFSDRLDKTSGWVYGAAQVQITDMTDTIPNQ